MEELLDGLVGIGVNALVVVVDIKHQAHHSVLDLARVDWVALFIHCLVHYHLVHYVDLEVCVLSINGVFRRRVEVELHSLEPCAFGSEQGLGQLGFKRVKGLL